MQKRQLGRSGIEVSALGMGCWAIGGPWRFLDSEGGWGQVDDAESIRAVHRALDAGITLFDTAENYGAGHSETVLGRALAGRRESAIVATKFGWKVDGAAKRVMPMDRPEDVLATVRAACEGSLRRLGTDYIDLYQFHVPDFPLELAERLRDQLEALVAEGKIRCYGWSTHSPLCAAVFAEGAGCAAIQHDLNVVRDMPDLIALCERENLASINRSPLARGALTGKYSADTTFGEDDVRRDAWSRANFFAPAIEHLEALRDILTSGGRTLAQGALAWIWGRSRVTVPIPGIRSVAQAEENAGAMAFGALSAEQMAQVEALVGPRA